MAIPSDSRFNFRPLTPDEWEDFEQLFGANGACGGCWCLWWHQTGKEFDEFKGEHNKHLMKKRVFEGTTPGLLGYLDDIPVAWCAVEPRENYSKLSRSRILKPLDDTPVWSIVCFFVHKEYRRHGLMTAMLRSVADYVARNHGTTIEGYPVDPKKPQMPDVFAYTGLATAFQKVGFEECIRRSETRPIMRLALSPK